VGAAEVGGEAQGRSAKKSQQGAVSKDSLRNAKGKCREASARLSAERQPTTHPNTLGGYDHVRIFENFSYKGARKEPEVSQRVPKGNQRSRKSSKIML
jgi:hypothetical protein